MYTKKAVFDYNAVYSDFLSSEYCVDLFFCACLISMYEPKNFFWNYMSLTFTRRIGNLRDKTISMMFDEGSDVEIFEWAYKHQHQLNIFIADDVILSKKLNQLLTDFPSYENIPNSDTDIRDIITIVMKMVANPHATTTCGCGSSFTI